MILPWCATSLILPTGQSTRSDQAITAERLKWQQRRRCKAPRRHVSRAGSFVQTLTQEPNQSSLLEGLLQCKLAWGSFPGTVLTHVGTRHSLFALVIFKCGWYLTILTRHTWSSPIGCKNAKYAAAAGWGPSLRVPQGAQARRRCAPSRRYTVVHIVLLVYKRKLSFGNSSWCTIMALGDGFFV